MNISTSGSNMSNPHYRKAVEEYPEANALYLEDVFQKVLMVYLEHRAKYAERDMDLYEAEQLAFEKAGDMYVNGTGIEIYMPAFEKWLQIKGISREPFSGTPFPETARRESHGGR